MPFAEKAALGTRICLIETDILAATDSPTRQNLTLSLTRKWLFERVTPSFEIDAKAWNLSAPLALSGILREKPQNPVQICR
jgi:hypothetical protein